MQLSAFQPAPSCISFTARLLKKSTVLPEFIFSTHPQSLQTSHSQFFLIARFLIISSLFLLLCPLLILLCPPPPAPTLWPASPGKPFLSSTASSCPAPCPRHAAGVPWLPVFGAHISFSILMLSIWGANPTLLSSLSLPSPFLCLVLPYVSESNFILLCKPSVRSGTTEALNPRGC